METATETGAEISYSNLVRANRERVYDAFATAESLDAWFTDGATVDARPGGEIHFIWKDWGPDHLTQEFAGDVVEAVRPERFVYRWYGEPGKFTTVEIVLQQREDGTVVKLREYGYPATLEGYKGILEAGARPSPS